MYPATSPVIPIPGSNPVQPGFQQQNQWTMPNEFNPVQGQSLGLDGTIDAGGSMFANMFGANSMGNGGFMSNLPGYALGALSYLDQKKTNKLNRKVTQYGLDRKQTEDAAYDKYKKDWSGMSFKA